MTKFPSDDYLLVVYQEYQKELEKANMMDFDDLLLIPYLILKNNPDILAKRQRKFQFVLVDEAQDTNRIQFEIMKQFTKNGGNIIGDDFQSIYRRRGAMMDNFLNVKSIRPDIIIHKLQMNYRSKPHIVHASNQIIKNNQKQYEKTVTPHRAGNDKIVIMSHGDEIDEAKHIIELIAKIKEEKKKKREQFAILYRKNALSSSFEQQLIMEGIPYKIFGGFKFLERKEVKDILAYVKYLYNPKDNVSLKRIINTPRRGISDDTVKTLEEYGMINGITIDEIINNPIEITKTGLASRAIESCKKFSQTMVFLKDSLETMTPENLISQIISTISYKEYLTETEGKQAQEKIDNLGELINLAGKYEL
jgi:DNA helicase II / ATP-dependent DNA helicase PcrA